MKKYRAGNFLRGFFEGEFSSIEEAWSYLSKRFLLSFPTDDPDGTRWMGMTVKETNPYEREQFLDCFDGQTELNDLPKDDVLKRCKHSLHSGL